MKVSKALLWIALALASAGCNRDNPVELIASAKEYLAKREYNAAVIQLKNALQKDPDNAEARYLLGVASLDNGDVASAEFQLQKAAQLGLRSESFELAQARTLSAKGDAKGVISQYGAKTLSDPKLQAELHAVVGSALLTLNDPAQAGKRFEAALAADSTNANARLGLARLLASKGALDKALQHVAQAISSSPANVAAHHLKGDLLATQGDAQAAEAAYREAIRIAPRQPEARLGLIVHLVRQQALEKAEAELAELEKAAPKDPRVAYARAHLQLAQRKFSAARESMLQVLKVAPEHVPSLTLAGMAALESGALAEAESHLRKAVSKAPEATNARRLLVRTHLSMGRLDLALAAVQELLKLSQEPESVALAGEVYLANGDVAAAASHYERANAVAPKNSAFQTRLAMIHVASGDSERGIRELQATSAADANAYQADLALITTHLRKREADKALEAVAALEKKQPKNPLTHSLRGSALMLKKDFAGARASFEHALSLQPNFMPAVSNLTALDVREKKYDAAKQRYQAILKKEPNNELALLGLSVLLRVSGADPQEIEKLVRQSVAANPSSVNARLALINFYVRGRDSKTALNAAQEAHAALPNEPRILQALGQAQLTAGENRQAVASFMRLAELQPKAPEPQLLLARAHMAEKRHDEAIKALRAAIAIRPDLPAAHREIARIYIATNRHSEALREAKALQAERPNESIGHTLEAETYIAQKKLDLAERTYRAALRKFDQPDLAVRTHAVLEAAGKRSEAQSLADEWLNRHPKDTVMLSYLGQRDLVAKRYESAAKYYRSALERMPENPTLLNNVAWVSHELKRPEALEYAERAHELAPGNAAIMDTLGTILAGSGQTERGLELLGRAAELAPDAPQIRLNFAKALLKAGRKAAARKELEQLAKLDSRLPQQQEAAKLLGAL